MEIALYILSGILILAGLVGCILPALPGLPLAYVGIIFFFPPLGLIVGPFLGAVVGELLNGEGTKTALKSGAGSFLGFILTTGLKIAVCGLYIWYFIKSFV